MVTEKKELLKCSCGKMNSCNKVHSDIRKKCFYYITGVVILLAMVASICCVLIRINQLEDEVRKAEATFNKVMKIHEDIYMLMNPILLGPSETEDEKEDYDYDYPEYEDDEEYKPATNLTKDGKHDDGVSLAETNLTDIIDEGKHVAKRSVVAATRDGVLINSESYAEIKAKNSTHRKRVDHDRHEGKSVTALPARPSAFGFLWPNLQSSYDDFNSGNGAGENESNTNQAVVTEERITTKKPSVSVRRSRVMRREDPSKAFRRVFKKPLLKSVDTEYDSYLQSEEIFTTTEAPVVHHRKLARTRPLITIQFNGDTSRYVLGKHENFKGNGHLRHPHRNFVDWTPSDWVRKTGMDSHFSLNQGIVTIKQTGLYFVYAQIYYLDEHDTTGYRVFRNTDMILQCTVTQHSSVAMMKGNTCYTAGVEFLVAGDTVYLSDITPEKYSLFEPGKSFFGLIKLGDFKNK